MTEEREAEGLEKDVNQVRQRGVPLVAVTTADEYVLERQIAQWVLTQMKEWQASKRKTDPAIPSGEGTLVLGWDCIRGPYGLSKAAKKLLEDMAAETDLSQYQNPTTFLGELLPKLPAWTAIIMRGAHRVFDPEIQGSAQAFQGLMNLRDLFKMNYRNLYLLGPSFNFPVDVIRNLHVLDDPLPGEQQRLELITRMHNDAGVKMPDERTVAQLVSATRGLHAFGEEQALSLAVAKGRLDPDILWRRWRQSIDAVKGLRVEQLVVKPSDIGGLVAMLQFADKLMTGKNPPDCIVRIEEIEKALAGSSGSFGDTSGASQGILGALLTWMQEGGVSGMIAAGPPGTGKSMSSVALGAISSVPTITFDIGSLKGSLVGQTEANTRDALRTLSAMARNIFAIATCNSLQSLPPELKRRFNYGIWYFDLPSAEERASIWPIYIKKYNLLPAQDLPPANGWTGAEIRTCCELADRLQLPLNEAARWIVPVARTAQEQIESLRKQANGRWLSASRPGAYVMPQGSAAQGSSDLGAGAVLSRKLDMGGS